MEKLKVYYTNAALGYNQFAYLIKVEQKKDMADYLVIGRENIPYDMYRLGSVEKDLENIYVTECEFDLNESPLAGTFLFDYFLKNVNNETKS